MSNFRLGAGITSPIYVSKAGNDSNAGTLPTAPKKSIQSSTANQIIGTGVYEQVFTNTPPLHIDGDVVIKSPALYANTITLNHVNLLSNGRLIVRHYLSVVFSGFNILRSICRAIIDNVSSIDIPSTGNVTINGLIVKEVSNVNDSVLNGTFTRTLHNCLFYNCGAYNTNVFAGSGRVFNNCHFGFQQMTLNNLSHTNLRNCNFPSPCKIRFIAGGTWYAIQDGKTGTPQDHGYDIDVVWATGVLIRAELGSDARGTAAQWDTAINSCISRDPLFNDPDNLDFSVKSASPLIARGLITNQGNGNIANVVYAKNYSVTALNNLFSDSAGSTENIALTSDANLALDPDGSIVINSGTQGMMVTDWMPYSTLLAEIGRISGFYSVDYDKDQAGGGTKNRNVMDNETFQNSGSDIGRNPDRLIFEMLASTQTAKPTNDSQADWQGVFPAGAWKKFQWSEKPTVDINGRTNGEKEFVVNPLNVGLNAKWLKFRFITRNDYL